MYDGVDGLRLELGGLSPDFFPTGCDGAVTDRVSGTLPAESELGDCATGHSYEQLPDSGWMKMTFPSGVCDSCQPGGSLLTTGLCHEL